MEGVTVMGKKDFTRGRRHIYEGVRLEDLKEEHSVNGIYVGNAQLQSDVVAYSEAAKKSPLMKICVFNLVSLKDKPYNFCHTCRPESKSCALCPYKIQINVREANGSYVIARDQRTQPPVKRNYQRSQAHIPLSFANQSF